MKYSLDEIAAQLGAVLEGDGQHPIASMAELALAGPQELSFAESVKYVDLVSASAAGAIIVGPDFPAMVDKNLLRCEQARTAFVGALEMFAPERRIAGIHPSAIVAAEAQIGEGVGIGPGVVIEPGAPDLGAPAGV